MKSKIITPIGPKIEVDAHKIDYAIGFAQGVCEGCNDEKTKLALEKLISILESMRGGNEVSRRDRRHRDDWDSSGDEIINIWCENMSHESVFYYDPEVGFVTRQAFAKKQKDID